MKTWTVLRINCDCASYLWLREREPSGNHFPRCKFCRKSLGDLEWKQVGKIKADTELEAMQIHKDQQKLRMHFINLLDRVSKNLDISVLESIYGLVQQKYSEKHRAYHNLSHLQFCLDLFEESHRQAADPDAVELALWYHDLFYDPQRHDNEMWSAAAAVTDGERLKVNYRLICKTKRLILATQHRKSSYEGDEAVIVDLDLAILGADREKFLAYEDGIRKEYSFVPVAIFKEKRAEILEGFLARKTIFNTPYFRKKFESKARENLRFSINLLRE